MSINNPARIFLLQKKLTRARLCAKLILLKINLSRRNMDQRLFVIILIVSAAYVKLKLGEMVMTIDEAKKILLAAKLSPLEQNALHVFLQEIDYKDLPDEEWRDVVGYEGLYQVSNFGRVKSFQKNKVKILKSNLGIGGYLRVVLCKNEKKKNRFVHVLVAKAFITNPENKTQVNHRDGNKKNNHVSNLEWVTPKENIEHAFKNGLRKIGYEHHEAKLLPDQIREVRRDCVPGDPERGFRAFAKKFNVTHRIISDAYYGKSYQNVE